MFRISSCAIVLTLLGASIVFTACDEIPSGPEEGERVRVALITVREPSGGSGRWVVYELDDEGTVDPVVESASPILEARYTSYETDRRGVAYLTEDGTLHIRDLTSGSESTEEGPIERFRFAPDGVMLTFTRVVPSASGEEAEQVFVLNRAADTLLQVTHDECATADPPEPCAWSAGHSVFGESSELYMVRRLRTADGRALTSLSLVTSALVEHRYVVVAADSVDLHPTSFFEGALLGSYQDTEAGMFALNTRSGDLVTNTSSLQHVSFCHDAAIAGTEGGVLFFVNVAGEEVGRVTLPHAATGEVLSMDCSRRAKFIPR